MAEHAHTTSCSSATTRPPAVARRDIAAGGLAMLGLVAAAAGSAKARVLADVIALDEPMVASLCADLLGRASA